jgi:glucokinase
MSNFIKGHWGRTTVENSKKPIVAVDIGGTKFIVAVVDNSGQILSRSYCLTHDEQGRARVIARLTEYVYKTVKKAGLNLDGIGGISLAVAGIIDINRRVITEAPNLYRWKNVGLASLIEDEIGIPAFLINDASAAAVGENRYGSGRGIENMIYITVSTGIGGGLIIGGKLYSGYSGSAGEIGHMIIKTEGPVCNCGRCGCLESLASGTAMARMARERIYKGNQDTMLKEMDVNAITAEDIAAAARKGDRLCLEVIDEAGFFLGVGFANLVNIFNPQMIVVGGGVAQMGEMLLRPVRKSMKQHAFKLPSAAVRVVKSKLGSDAGVLGAAAYVRSIMEEEE